MSFFEYRTHHSILYLLTLVVLTLFCATEVKADQVYWSQGNSKGATPYEAAVRACDNYQYCVSVNILPYIVNPSRTDLVTAEYILSSGNVWKTETVRMSPCGYDDYYNCSQYTPDAGAGVCEDGFYTDSANPYGYVDTCDRPALKLCDSGVVQLETGICPVEPPICADYESCLQYAQESTSCEGAISEEFTFVDPQNWSYTCELPDSSLDDLPWYGCDGEWCGGIDHVSETSSSSSSSSSSQSSSSSSVSSSSSSSNSSDSSDSGNSSSSSSSIDDGNGTGGDSGGEASGGESCEAPPQCGGDSIQCALLQQQWLQRCPGQELNEFEGLQYELDMEERVQQAVDQYEDRFTEIKDDFEGLISGHLSSGEADLYSDKHDIKGTEVELGIASREDFFSLIRYVIYFGCALLSFYILVRA